MQHNWSAPGAHEATEHDADEYAYVSATATEYASATAIEYAYATATDGRLREPARAGGIAYEPRGIQQRRPVDM